MRITLYRFILFSCVLFQAFTVVQPQLLGNVGRVLENIGGSSSPTSSSPPASSKDASPPPTKSSSSSPPPPPPQSSQTPEAVATTAPATTTTSSSSPPPPPPPTSSSSEKAPVAPTTSKKQVDPSTDSSPPSTSDTPTTPNNTPTTPNTPASTPSSGVSTPKSNKNPPGNNKSTAPTKSSTDDSDSTTDSTSLPSSTATGVNKSVASPNSNNNNSGNKTGTIVGAVVGSIFGVALIGGVLTWVNRHGGCARRRDNKRSADFEDFGLADTDFPHHRSPAMQSVGLATAATPIAAAAAVSPTIPRLNEQGNFYGGSADPYSAAYNNQQAYQPQLDMPPSSAYVSDYSQQPYYYQQPAAVETGVTTGAGYYDENGYYYDGSNNQQQKGINHSSNPSYDMTAGGQYHLQQPYSDQMQHQTYSDQLHSYPDQSSYPPTSVGGGDHYYKPDQVDIKPHQRM